MRCKISLLKWTPILVIGMFVHNTLASDDFETLEKEMAEMFKEDGPMKKLKKKKRSNQKKGQRPPRKVKADPAPKEKAVSASDKVISDPQTAPQQTATNEAPLTPAKTKEQKLKERLEKNKNDLTAKQELGYIYLRQKKYDEVIKTLRTDSDRLSRRGLLTLARAYDKKNNLKEMIRILTVYVTSRQADHVLLTILGDANRRAEIPTVAVSHFKSAIQLKPNYMPAWHGLVKTFEDTRNTYELTIVYNDMIKTLGPRDEAYNELCRLYAEGGFIDKAKNFCQEAIQRTPRKPENHLYLGQTLIDGGNPKQGQRIVKQAAKQFGKSEKAQWKAGDISESQANYAGAARFYLRGTKADPDSARSFLGLARSQFELKQYEVAYDAFFKACKLDKTKTQNFKTAGKQLRNEGKLKLHKKYAAGLGTCLLKKPTQLMTDGGSEPVWESID